ncbi:MAG: tetratricopeptide repeat protein [Candidatus Riflebacteria bacterium]|nr:tetratricopeptide repeat protein [Candidatus Riflebacteria bacterium]
MHRSYLLSLLFILVAAIAMAQTTTPVPAPAKGPAPVPAPAKAAPPAAGETQVPSRPVDPVMLNNQMMVTASERIKAGALAEARKIAEDMIYGHEKITDSAQGIVRTFSSMMGKKLYEAQMKQEGRPEPVIWLQQPIADGFYFLAIIDFQEKKFADALAHIQQAIQWDPTRAAFYIERGFLMVNQPNPGSLADIAASYLKALELADGPEDFAGALRGLGYVYIEQNDWEGGLACYLVSLFFDPQSEAAKQEIDFIKYNRPKVFQELDGGKAVTALARRKVPTRIAPIHIQTLLQIADELSPTTQARELKAVLKRALLLDPKNETIKKRLAALK